jgi:hypothetical protein
VSYFVCFAISSRTAKFDPKVLPQSYLVNPKEGQAFVYGCTIQRMMINLFGRNVLTLGEEEVDEDAQKADIPIHAFDVIREVARPGRHYRGEDPYVASGEFEMLKDG